MPTPVINASKKLNAKAAYSALFAGLFCLFVLPINEQLAFTIPPAIPADLYRR